MGIYILNMASIGVYSLVYNYIPKASVYKSKVKYLFIGLITIQLILILSLRDISVGYDLETYAIFFENVSLGFSDYVNLHRFEVGYKFLNILISIISTNEQFFIAILSIIAILPVSFFIYKNSKMPFLSYTIYISFNYFHFIFSGLRQGISFALVFLSYTYIKKRDFKMFLFLIILAGLFHKSSFIFIFAYFFYRIRLTKKVVIGYIFSNILIFIFRRSIFQLFIDYFYDSFVIVESSSYSWLLFCTIILIMGSFAYKRMMEESNENIGVYVFLMMGLSLMIFSSVGNNVMRVADYYYMFVIIFIPNVLFLYRKDRFVPVIAVLIVVGIILVWISFLISDGYGITPYRFFWQ